MKPLDITKPCVTNDEHEWPARYEHTFDLGGESRILFVVKTDIGDRWTITYADSGRTTSCGYSIRNVEDKRTVWLVGYACRGEYPVSYLPFNSEGSARDWAETTDLTVVDGPFPREIEVQA